MANIKIKRGSGVPSGLTFGELAFDTTNKKLYIGLTAGAELLTSPQGGVSSVNGLTGAVINVARTNVNNNFTTGQSIDPTLQVIDNNISGNYIQILPQSNQITNYQDLTSATGVLQFSQPTGFGYTVTIPATTTVLAGLSNTQTFTSTNTFNALTTFSSGISAAGATFSSLVRFNAGISAAGGTFSGTQTFVNGATFQGNINAPNIVTSFNGLTGAVTGVTTGSANTFGPLQSFTNGISAAGATFAGNLNFKNIADQNIIISKAANGILIADESTGSNAFIGMDNSSGTKIDNVILPIRIGDTNESYNGTIITVDDASSVMSLTSALGSVSLYGGGDINLSSLGGAINLGSASSGVVLSGGTILYFNDVSEPPNYIAVKPPNSISGNITFTLPGTLGVTGQVLTATDNNGILGWSSKVTTINGLSGGVTLAAGSGINLSVSGQTMTFSNTGVLSFNGLTGAVTGVTTGTSNTFTALQTFNSGISAAGGVTFAGTVASDTGYRITSNAINAQTGTTYTFLATDNGKVVTFNNGSAITVTIPTGLPVGFNCTGIQLGTGQVGFTAASGVTLNAYSSAYKIAGQHGAASLVSYTTNIYNLSGSLNP